MLLRAPLLRADEQEVENHEYEDERRDLDQESLGSRGDGAGCGIIGKVIRVDENEVELEIAPNVRVKVLKGTLSDVRPHGAKPAND